MSRALSRIHVEGFRSLKSVDLEPGRITVLIGPNGAGKSNLLAFLQMVPLIRTKSLRRFVGEGGGASSLLHYGMKVTREISFRLEFTQPQFLNVYSARLGYASGDAFVFLEEEVGRRSESEADFDMLALGVGHQESKLDDMSRGDERHTERSVLWWLRRMSFYHFHDTSTTSELRTNSRAEDSRYLRSNGSNLAAYLAALRWSESEADQKAWRRINLYVRQLAPYIKELCPTAVGKPVSAGDGEEESEEPVAGQTVRLDWIDTRDEVFGPHHLSDGTLRAIALITALAQPAANMPAFISIDEPELGLHPVALSVLAGLIRSVSHRCQVLLATQSPALLDHFDAGDVVVSELCDGHTELRRLDPDELAAWLEEYSLSELFDKNVLGGRP